GGWAALSGCRFVRLNHRSEDAEGLQGWFWQASAQAAYAQRHGIAWESSAPVVLGFARESGLTAIAESKQHPIPADLRPYLDDGRRAGPFTLYRIVRGPTDVH